MTGKEESGGYRLGQRRIAVVYLTPTGQNLAERLRFAWARKSVEIELFQACQARAEDQPFTAEAGGAARSLTELAEGLWTDYDSLVFIMAVGIVVRVLAPLIKSKWADPGVVVMDECGTFAVSLLSGHWGQANLLAQEVAHLVDATPVVTTATDAHGLPAVDLLASQCGFTILPRSAVKLLSGDLLRGKPVKIFTEWDLTSFDKELQGITLSPLDEFTPAKGAGSANVLVTSRVWESLPEHSLYLCPHSLAAGIGCTRDTPAEEIEEALMGALQQAGRHRESLCWLATHEIKHDEQGLQDLARRMGLLLQFFNSERLQQVLDAHPELDDDSFVRAQLGVGGVCETAALAMARRGTLVLPKWKTKHVTVALAEAGLLWSGSGRAIRKI
jgi:cobalt-precorrin 5A hydrolase